MENFKIFRMSRISWSLPWIRKTSWKLAQGIWFLSSQSNDVRVRAQGTQKNDSDPRPGPPSALSSRQLKKKISREMIRSFKNKSQWCRTQHLTPGTSWFYPWLSAHGRTQGPVPRALFSSLLSHLGPETSALRSSMAKRGQQNRESQSDPHTQR